MPSALVQAVILAAGKSSRFRTDTTKLAFTLAGQAMILYPVKLLASLNIPITLVIGYQKEVVKNIIAQQALIDNISFVEQHETRGTGHAVRCTKDQWYADHILVMNGDMPLINEAVIKNLIEAHISDNAAITFVTAHNTDPSLEGYGKVIKEDTNIRIIEARDFNRGTTQHSFINAGIYLFKRSFLQDAIEQLPVHQNTGELYITDLVHYASHAHEKVSIIEVPFDTVRGVNTLKELWTAEYLKRCEIIAYWMDNGVRFAGPQYTYIDVNVTIGSNTFVGTGAHIVHGSRIGDNCHIDAFSIISNSILHNHATILSHSVIKDAEIESHATVGPFAHLRNNTIIEHHATVGNFVEATKTTLGSYSKVKHLSYIGNAIIGSQVNLGAGTITCNYDGHTKHTTVIENNVHIGSNNALIAPITIGESAITAAGSVITESVPPNALAIGRARQVNKENYAQRLRQKPYQAALKTSNTTEQL